MILSLRNRLKILVYFGAAVLLVVGLFDGGPKVAGITVGRLAIVDSALFILLTTFDRYLWRLPPVVRVLRTGPVLRGTWRGTGVSADTGQSFTGYLSVRQTYSQIDVRLLTLESTSETTSSQLLSRPEGLAVLEYLYENIPKPSVRERSPIHFGTARMECVGQWPTQIDGVYWTDRRSTGELKFDERRKQIVQSYEAAETLFS